MNEPKPETSECPFCHESIRKAAIKCKHCGSTLVPIAENINNGSSGGPNQSVQIVTNTTDNKDKSSTVWVAPTMMNRYLGHGWSILIINFLVMIMILSYLEDGDIDASIGFLVMSSIVTFPWFIWVVSRPSSNKVVPIIGILFLIISIVVVIEN